MTSTESAQTVPDQDRALSWTWLTIAVVCGVLWLGGVGSMVALVMGLRTLRHPGVTSMQRRWAIAAIALGVVGVLVTLSGVIAVASVG